MCNYVSEKKQSNFGYTEQRASQQGAWYRKKSFGKIQATTIDVFRKSKLDDLLHGIVPTICNR